ncbi:MAG: hypothetical protein JO235_05320 [Chroococcidiopsidaceae cyanobacterium CP_BM_RX_35]|nr:hypothetical protein [Chroococcidiopsidaceae cyanobacterium CP_BM_RX_35]
MKSINTIFPLSALLPQLLIGGISLNTLAQQPQQSYAKEHLKYCVGKLTVQVNQARAIKGVMQQPNLTQEQKLQQVGDRLTPQQKQQLRACMQQPIPSQK